MTTPNTPEALLSAREICVLATVSPDGSAHAMPMWYLYDAGKIWFMTSTGSQKYKNVERTGNATVTLDVRERPYYAIMVKGSAEVAGVLDPERQFRLFSRYISEQRARDYMERLARRGGSASIIVTPTKTVEFRSDL